MPVPAWLTVSSEMLALAEAWVATPTYEAEHDHLAQHPELLDKTFDVVVDEALLGVSEQDVGRYRELRAAAREHGVSAAYRPLLLTSLAHQFIDAGPAQQQRLIAERRADLLDDAVLDYLHRLDEQDDADDRPTLALVLLRLAHTDQDELLTAVFTAMDHPDQFPGLLTSIARQTEPTALEEIAVLAWRAARTVAEAANAAFHLAVAAAIDGDDTAPDMLREARDMEPGQTSTWIVQLAEYGAIHPTVLPLIKTLTEVDTDADQ